MGSGGRTVQQTTQTQSAPEISGYSLPGYIGAEQYYGNQLQQPSVYPGPVLAPPGTGQLSAIDQTYNLFGSGVPTPLQQQAQQTLGRGAAGGLFQPRSPIAAPTLYGPSFATPPTLAGPLGPPQTPDFAAMAASYGGPMVRNFAEQVMPGIQARSLFAGQGPASSREQVATMIGSQALGDQIAQSAVGPAIQAQANYLANVYGTQAGQGAAYNQALANIYGTQVGQGAGLNQAATNLFNAQVAQNLGLGSQGLQGAGLQLQAAGMTPQATQDMISALTFLSSMGGLENYLMQQPLTAAQQMFQQPQSIQGQAAQALLNATISGGGGMTGVQTGSQDQGAMGTIGSIMQILGPIIGLVAMCWVADAVYGPETDDALAARHYVTRVWKGPLANATRWIYRKVGPKVAKQVSKRRWLKSALKPLFDVAARRGRQDLLERAGLC